MALLVCYSENPPHDHTASRAIYLDHAFYELIFAQCRGERNTSPILGAIASLRYKSPVLVVVHCHVATLAAELQHLATMDFPHPQIAELRTVCNIASQKGYALTISGDMYPELCGNVLKVAGGDA